MLLRGRAACVCARAIRLSIVRIFGVQRVCARARRKKETHTVFVCTNRKKEGGKKRKGRRGHGKARGAKISVRGRPASQPAGRQHGRTDRRTDERDRRTQSERQTEAAREEGDAH